MRPSAPTTSTPSFMLDSMPVRRSRSARSSLEAPRKAVGELVERLAERDDLVVPAARVRVAEIARGHLARGFGQLAQLARRELRRGKRNRPLRRATRPAQPCRGSCCICAIASSTSVSGSATRAAPMSGAFPV